MSVYFMLFNLDKCKGEKNRLNKLPVKFDVDCKMITQAAFQSIHSCVRDRIHNNFILTGTGTRREFFSRS